MRAVASRFLLLLFLSLAACPKRVVMVNGQEMPVAEADDAVRRELNAIRAESRSLPPVDAADRLVAFARRYPGVPSAAEALHEAARHYLDAKQPARAADALQALLADHPLYPRATEAKYDLATADLALGRPRDALATFASVYPQLPAELKPRAAAQAAAAAEAAGAMPDAVRWMNAVAESSQGEARAEALRRAADAVDRLAFLDVAKLKEELPPEAPVQQALTMKLARIQLHLRDYARAAELAREVFLRWPDGPYAADARAVVDRIAKLTFVRPNVLGLAVPLSGQYKPWGEAILRGVGIALEGTPGVKLVVRDTRGEPDGAAAALEALALEEGAIVVVGGVTLAEAERAAATAEELQLPFVSLSRQEGITAAGPHVFQNMLLASAQAKALADFAMGRRGMKRFAVVYPQVPYGVELANAFWDEVEARGGEIRGAETYAADRTTFTPLVKDMVGKLYLDERSDFKDEVKQIGEKEKDPFRRRKAVDKAREALDPVIDFQAVFIPDFARNVKLIAPALAVEDVVTQTCLPEEVARIRKSTGRKDLEAVQLLGANTWGGDDTLFDTSPGAPGRHLRCAIFVDGFFAGSARPATKAFVDAFAKKYPQVKAPSILEASAHDAIRMARDLVVDRRVQTREDLRAGLVAVRGFKGATGDLSFGPDRTPQKELFYLLVDPAAGLRELTREELSGPGPGSGGP
jgi:ABC-type branched-subunit amino acid transport system substrate-binding protein